MRDFSNQSISDDGACPPYLIDEPVHDNIFHENHPGTLKLLEIRMKLEIWILTFYYRHEHQAYMGLMIIP